jgi:hypothetical protein
VPSHHPPHPRQVEHCHRWIPRDPHHGISSPQVNWGQLGMYQVVFHTIASELLRIMTCDDHSHGSYSTPLSVLDLRLISETALAGEQHGPRLFWSLFAYRKPFINGKFFFSRGGTSGERQKNTKKHVISNGICTE